MRRGADGTSVDKRKVTSKTGGKRPHEVNPLERKSLERKRRRVHNSPDPLSSTHTRPRLERDSTKRGSHRVRSSRAVSRMASTSRPRSAKIPPQERPSTNIFDPKHDRNASSSKIPRSPFAEEGEKAESPKTPLDHILNFAIGRESKLSDIQRLDHASQVRKRFSLATFNGCGGLEHVSIFSFLRVHCEIHRKTLEGKDGNDFKTMVELDDVSSKASIQELRLKIANLNTGGSGDDRPQESFGESPPLVEKTVDFLQLVLRLLGKMSSREGKLETAFITKMYEESTMHSIFHLLVAVIKLSKSLSCSGNGHSDIIEFTCRLLRDTLVLELTPYDTSLPEFSIGKSILSLLAKGGVISHSEILSFCADCIDHEFSSGNYLKTAVSEIMQLYFVRMQLRMEDTHRLSELWNCSALNGDNPLSMMIERKSFWSVAVATAIQDLMKDNSEYIVRPAIVFLTSLFKVPSAVRLLLGTHSKIRHSLLIAFTRRLQRISGQTVKTLAKIEHVREENPMLPTEVEFINKVMTYAVVQREIITSCIENADIKTDYFQAIDNIISQAAKLVTGTAEEATIIRAARSQFPQRGLDDISRSLHMAVDGYIRKRRRGDYHCNGDNEKRLKAIAMFRALAFAASLLGSLGKSMEDGSRDMSRTNGLQLILSSRFNSNRSRQRLWTDVIKIQSALRLEIPSCLLPNEEKGPVTLIGDAERNHFQMAVERIRKELQKASRAKKLNSISDRLPRGAVMKVKGPGSSNVAMLKPSLPEFKAAMETQTAICSNQGYKTLDDDPIIIERVAKISKQEAQKSLAMYDPDSSFPLPWIKLRKKNAYVNNARAHLEKSDRILGNPCSCLPGNPNDRKDGVNNRIACSDDSCENRQIKLECVPGECGAGRYCRNQRLQKQEYARTKTVRFGAKGSGVVANENIRAGSFVGEYQGEVISMEEFGVRKDTYRGERHFYFMTLTNKLVIDASRKSQFTRFINHSCNPNAETQKWNAGGEPRVGIFAIKDIAKGDEITFDYGARSIDNTAVPCLCGAENCRGFLTKKKENTTKKDPQKQPPAEDDANLQISEADEDLQTVIDKRIKNAKRRMDELGNLKQKAKAAKEMQAERLRSFSKDTHRSTLLKWNLSAIKVINKRRNKTAKPAKQRSPHILADESFRIPRRPPKPSQPSAKKSILETYQEQRRRDEDAAYSRVKTASRRQFSSRLGGVNGGNRTQRFAASTDVSLRQTSSNPRIAAGPGKQLAGSRIAKKMPSFAPTTTRHKRILLPPRIAKKDSKKKRVSDEVDSMDGYSTASSVDPIYNESENEIVPDGLGATPDDEFTAAPPVTAENRPDGERRRQQPEVSHNPGHRRGQHGAHEASRHADNRRNRWHRGSVSRRHRSYDNGRGGQHFRRAEGGRFTHGSEYAGRHSRQERQDMS